MRRASGRQPQAQVERQHGVEHNREEDEPQLGHKLDPKKHLQSQIPCPITLHVSRKNHPKQNLANTPNNSYQRPKNQQNDRPNNPVGIRKVQLRKRKHQHLHRTQPLPPRIFPNPMNQQTMITEDFIKKIICKSGFYLHDCQECYSDVVEQSNCPA
jgi:hypothetical protein